MMLIVLGGLSANHVRQHEKYLLEDERWLVAEPFVSDDLASEFYAMRSIAKEYDPVEALGRGVLSFDDAEAISPRRALEISRETLTETPFATLPGAFVVHGPPNEPTRIHVHFPFTLATPEKIYRRAEARRTLWDAAVKVAARHGLTVPHRTGERYHLRIARAARVWQTTPTLHSWILDEVWPQVSPAMSTASSWDEVNAIWSKARLRFVQTPRGGAALLDDSTGKAVRASAIAIELSRSALEQRFGPLPEFPFIAPSPQVERTFATAAATVDTAEIERHRAARAAWSELYESRINAERSELDLAYGERCREIADTQKKMLSAIREVDFEPVERRALSGAARDYRSRAVDEALTMHTAEMRALYGRYPKKPSRKLREWQKDRVTKNSPVGRIIAFSPREPQAPRAPWVAVSSPVGGLDLYYGRRRVAIDDGKTIGILDPDLPTEAIAAMNLPSGYRVEGPAPLRERIRTIGIANNHEVSDGGEPEPTPGPLHAQIPDEPVARRCLAIMDALRMRPTVDGIPYRAGAQLPKRARRIELHDENVVVVKLREDRHLALDIQPTILAGECAVYRCADAASAEQLRARAIKAGLRVVDAVPANEALHFTDAPIVKLPAKARPLLDGSLLEPLPEEPTPERMRTRTRALVPERKKRRRR